MSKAKPIMWVPIASERADGATDERLGEGRTYRASVPGGWLVLFVADVMMKHESRSESVTRYNTSPAITFVPDQNHVWVVATDLDE